MSFLSHTYASKERDGCLVSRVDRCEYAMFSKGAKQPAEHAFDGLGPEPAPLVARIHGEADLHLLGIVCQEVDAKVADQQASLPYSNRKLEPSAWSTENGGLLFTDELLRIIERTRLK